MRLSTTWAAEWINLGCRTHVAGPGKGGLPWWDGCFAAGWGASTYLHTSPFLTACQVFLPSMKLCHWNHTHYYLICGLSFKGGIIIYIRGIIIYIIIYELKRMNLNLLRLFLFFKCDEVLDLTEKPLPSSSVSSIAPQWWRKWPYMSGGSILHIWWQWAEKTNSGSRIFWKMILWICCCNQQQQDMVVGWCGETHTDAHFNFFFW